MIQKNKKIYIILLISAFIISIPTASAFLPLEQGNIIIQNIQTTSNSKQGTINQTQANNQVINSGGYQLNFINGSGATVNVQNSHASKQVNVTISASGVASGVTSLNALTGALSIVCISGNTTCTSAGSTITVNTAWNLVTTGLSAQTITKQLTINNLLIGGQVNLQGNTFLNTGTITFPVATGTLAETSQLRTYQNNTGSNLGTSGTGVYSSMSGSALQFLKLICATPTCSFSSNSTNAILTIAGITDTNTAQIKNADGAAIGLFGSRLNATQNTVKTLSKTGCITLSDNGTNIQIGCTTGGVNSLNFTTSSDFDFNIMPRNMSYVSLDSTVFNFHLKPIIVLTNGSAQNFTTGKKIQTTSSSTTSGFNVGSLTSDITSARRGDLRIVGNSLKFNDNTNTTQTITPSTYLTTAVTSATGTSRNVTVSASTGAVTWNLGDRVIVTNGNAQNFTSGKKIQTTSSATTSGFNLGSLSSDITSPRRGDLRIIGNAIKYNDNTNTTQTITPSSYLTAAITSLDADTTAAQLLKANSALSNLTITDSGATHSFKLGSAVLITNGSKQIITKNLDFGQATQDVFDDAGIVIRNTAGTFGYNIIGGAITKNITITKPVPVDNVMESYQPRYNFTSPTNKSSTASATFVMYGGFATLTPRYSPNATITVSGYWNNNLANDGCWAIIKTNPTTSLGIAGTAASGISVGSSFKMISSPALGNQTFTKTVVYTGDVAGTKQYFDIAYARLVGGNCHIYNVDWYIREQ